MTAKSRPKIQELKATFWLKLTNCYIKTVVQSHKPQFSIPDTILQHNDIAKHCLNKKDFKGEKNYSFSRNKRKRIEMKLGKKKKKRLKPMHYENDNKFRKREELL